METLVILSYLKGKLLYISSHPSLIGFIFIFLGVKKANGLYSTRKRRGN